MEISVDALIRVAAGAEYTVLINCKDMNMTLTWQ